MSARSVAMVVYNDLVHDARVYKEACTLREAGYSIHVIGMTTDHTPPLVGWDEIPSTRLSVGPHRSLRLRYAVFWKAAYRALIQLRPGAVHAHDLDALVPAWLAARNLGVPLVYDAHEMWTELPSLVGRPVIRGIWKSISALLVPRADAVITVSDGIAGELARRYGVSPVVVRNLPPRREPPAPAPVRARINCPQTAPLLIYQGGLLLGLGIERAVAVMEQLPEAYLVIIGDGPLKETIRDEIARSSSSGRIALLPALPFSELPAVTAAADIGLHLGESPGLNVRLGLPNKLFEYVAAGVPVVMVDWPAQGQLVRDYGLGKLVPPGGSLEQVAAAIRDALAEHAALVENCHRATAELSWEREAVRLVECYARLRWR